MHAVRQSLRHKSADHFGILEADNRVYQSIRHVFCRQRPGRLPCIVVTGLYRGHINIGIHMGMSRRKMAAHYFNAGFGILR